MGINIKLSAGTVIGRHSGRGVIAPEHEPGVGLPFSLSAWNNVSDEPIVGQRVQFLPTSGYAEIVYPESFRHGSASLGKIGRDSVRKGRR